MTILKYLFDGAVGKDLLEGLLSESMESLEEMVLLVQETSVSVIYTHEMKRQLKPWFSVCPMLIEYLSAREEEEDIDALQARKCLDFKRMMLEAVESGRGIGIPIPLGYDNVYDIETWPLLQAFALDRYLTSPPFPIYYIYSCTTNFKYIN